MDKIEIKKILNLFVDKIKKEEFNLIWRLDGSANLLLQGVNTKVNDLDIATDLNGINFFRNYFKKFIIKDFLNTSINANTLILEINSFEIEINNYLDLELTMFEYIENISFENLIIPILPLDKALLFYKLIKREGKVNLITRYL